MYHVRDLMTRRVFYVTPQSTVQAAMDLLRIQQLEILPVVEDGILLGVLDSLNLYRFHGELPVREVMTDPLTIEADAPLGEAASLMLHHRLHQIPVVDETRLAGILSHRELLATWGASVDALTGLPWAEFMRRWAAGHLTAGREVAVLFMDLNDFGQFNKIHSHEVGNKVLRTVAFALRHQVDPRRDLLCRYGGDEFVIATTRTQEEAWQLAHVLHDAIAKADFGREDLRVGMAVGIAGGKRHLPRAGTHPSANVDDLINWASRAMTRAKSEPGRVVAFKGTKSEGPEYGATPAAPDGRLPFSALPPQGPRILVDDYSILHGAAGIEVTVHLRRGEETEHATVTHTGGGSEILHTVANATAACLQRFLTAGISSTVRHVRVTAEENVPGVVTAWISLLLPDQDQFLVGAVPLREDRYRSVINAVLDAANRRVAWLTQFRAADPRPETDTVLGAAAS